MDKLVTIETSARHIHLTKEDFATLFGADAQPTIKKELSQPGQFAYNEKVTVVGPKKEQPGVSILGPFRSVTQLELSATDARSLGMDAPIRLSGDVAGSAPCKLVGPKGEVELKEGVMVAKRHLHMTPEDAARMGVETDQVVSIKVASEERSLIFGDVIVRVSPDFRLSLHIDTDESNAAGCTSKTVGELIVNN